MDVKRQYKKLIMKVFMGLLILRFNQIEWQRGTSQNVGVGGAEDFVYLRLVQIRRGGELAVEVHVAALQRTNTLLFQSDCDKYHFV